LSFSLKVNKVCFINENNLICENWKKRSFIFDIFFSNIWGGSNSSSLILWLIEYSMKWKLSLEFTTTQWFDKRERESRQKRGNQIGGWWTQWWWGLESFRRRIYGRRPMSDEPLIHEITVLCHGCDSGTKNPSRPWPRCPPKHHACSWVTHYDKLSRELTSHVNITFSLSLSLPIHVAEVCIHISWTCHKKVFFVLTRKKSQPKLQRKIITLDKLRIHSENIAFFFK
jgi:hypothetical protein